jgi:UDP-N-acetylglucosamine 2-epimerase (non-hydrolysing)
MKPLIHVVAGARPNFMKVAPIVRALRADGRLEFKLVHTGQHRDAAMSDVFFRDLGLPPPDVQLEVQPGTHAEATANTLVAYERLCLAQRPAATLVVGDVTSTLACTLAAKKLHIPVAHVEAGLRSGDIRMPEEVNRLATDAICDWYFASEPSAVEHLRREGKAMGRVFFTGNVMVDNLLFQAARLEQERPVLETDDFKRGGPYGVVTLHRPGNVDDAGKLRELAQALREISRDVRLVFPVHPRTRAKLAEHGIDLGPRVRVLAPLGYIEFLNLWKDARVVLTDSGGLQEETTALGVPCVTLRDSTERPVTVEQGTNVLAGTQPQAIIAAAREVLSARRPAPRRPPLWDGRAAERIVQVLADDLAPLSDSRIVSGVARGVRRLEVLGCAVDDLTMPETLDVVEGFIARGRPHQHVVVNVDKLVKARRDPVLRRIVNECALVNADGMPVVWASRLLGTPLRERVAGVDLVDALMRRAAERGWRVYLLGARRDVVGEVVRRYQERFASLVVAGWRDGYWKPDEEEGVAEEIRRARADVLFVAISSPRKEQFLAKWQPRMRVPFAMGVGGTFDVAAGRVKRAPAWMQSTGLEWFYRFLQEPRRMFRRYFVDDMAFFSMLAVELLRRRAKATLAVLTSVALAVGACVGAIEA